MIVEITNTIDIVLTPEELAEEFWKKHSGYQARFFNWLGAIPNYSALCNQLKCIGSADELTNAGRSVMNIIGEYANEDGGLGNG